MSRSAPISIARRPARRHVRPHAGRARTLVASGVACTLALFAGACGGGDSDDRSGGDPAEPVELVEGVTVEVQTLDNRFAPPEISVRAGTTVVWHNDGRNDHNILPAEEGAFEPVETEAFRPGDEGRVRFTSPGTYRYYCSIHGTAKVGMVGTVVVEG